MGNPLRAARELATSSGCLTIPISRASGAPSSQKESVNVLRGSLNIQGEPELSMSAMMPSLVPRWAGVVEISRGGLLHDPPESTRIDSFRFNTRRLSRLPRRLSGLYSSILPAKKPADCNMPARQLVPLRCMPRTISPGVLERSLTVSNSSVWMKSSIYDTPHDPL